MCLSRSSGLTSDVARARINGSFTALQVAGGLLSPEFLTKVARLEAPRQRRADYGLVPSLELKEEIGRYWRIGSHWHGRYLRERQRLDRDATKVGIANWLEPFCSELLRYQDLAPTSSRHFDDREFKISHQAWGGSVPFLLLTHNMGLDTPVRSIGMEGLRVAPHALMQEYLNADDDALWGVVANGSRLRILRDNVSLTRAAYLEADLDLMFQDGLYADFAALWLFAHATRLEPVERNPSRCIAEVWRTTALAEGIRARDQLRGGVQEALSQLGTGLLQHPANQSLRQALASAEATPRDLLKQLLRLVYRLLFLFTAEDRGLLHAPDADAAAKALYQEGYSLAMLRIRAWRQRHYDRHSDLWRGLQVTFGGLAHGAPALALPALGGLFAQEQCALLDGLLLSNRHLLHAVRSLAYFHSGGGFARVNYRDMGTEELGSVYESLLDLYPVIEGHGKGAKLDFVKGDQQKLTGSYYTPPDLANQLIRSVLDPVIARTIQAHPAQPRKALLKLKVLDPACGSGHFLLAAARRLATELAKMDSDTGAYDEQTRQHALREVMCHCIYGVDKNDLAVELCKAALWIEAVEPGRPLTFLDHRIRLGDSLVGVVHPELIEDGIPQAAYQGIKGDDKAVCSALKRDNKLQAKGQVLQLGMFEAGTDETVTADGRLATMGEDTLEEVNKKRQVWDAGEATRARKRYPFDLYAAAFFVPKQRGTEHTVPTTKDLGLVRHKRPMRRAVAEATEQAAQQFQFFHWNVEMEEVMSRGAFDVILANPPWERITLNEKEFFASRAPRIAKAPNKAARQRLIDALSHTDATPADRLLLKEFTLARRNAASTSLFLHKSGRFPRTGVGDINTYAVFAETILDLLKPSGQAGMIVPTGVATDYGTKALFGDIVNQQRIISLYDFENRKKLFAGVHSSYKFSLLTVGGSQNTREVADYAFYLQDVADLAEKERHIPLSKEDFALFNPNTRTCPVFRSRRDLEIARKMYRRAGILWKEAQGQQPEVNPWGIRLYRMFDMSNDSHLFRTRQELEGQGFALTGNVFVKEQERYMPLYEAKLFHQYDHRFATFDGVSAKDIKKGKARRATAEEKARPDFVPIPRYWVNEKYVTAKLQAYNSGRITDHGSRITDHGSRITDHGSRITDQFMHFTINICQDTVKTLSNLARKSVSGG